MVARPHVSPAALFAASLAVLATAMALCGAPKAAAAPPAALKIYGMESRPISFRDGGRPDGMVVELAQQLLRRLGRGDEIEIIPWARANTVAQYEPNVLLLSIVRTPEREKRMVFVGPVFLAYISAFAVKGRAEELRALGDGIHRLRGGARRGSIFVERARGLGYNLTDETTDSETAARMLMMRRFDLWFDGEEMVGPALASAGYARGDVELVKRLSTEEVYFAFSQGTPRSLIDEWDAAFRAMKRDGSYQKIHRKWLPRYPFPPGVTTVGP